MKPKIPACNRYNNRYSTHLKHNPLSYRYRYRYKYKAIVQHSIRYKLETWKKQQWLNPFHQPFGNNTTAATPHEVHLTIRIGIVIF